ncbi:MAG: ABC transporter permease [Candidatus Heimdallarchaeota archaeon]|nr:MAG: ABC transporter permease [Candidatus Heimdallarchaeota archaeon]
MKKSRTKKASELSGSQLAIAFRRFRKNKAGLLGLMLALIIFLIAFFADSLTTFPPLEPMGLSYDYTPYYLPPGTVEGAIATRDTGHLIYYISPDFPFQDGSFETPDFVLSQRWDVEEGWEFVSLLEGQPVIFGWWAARSTGEGILSQNLSSDENIDLLYTQIVFQVYLDGEEPTTLYVFFTYEDGTYSKTYEFNIDGNNTWVRMNEYFYLYPFNMSIREKIRNPVKISFYKDNNGSDILLDYITLYAGEYFQNEHIFGTNWWGHDLYSKLVKGSQVSLIVSIGAIILSLAIGLPLGLVAGYYRGKTDEIIMRITDIFLTLPFYFVMILVIMVLTDTPDLDNLIIELGITAEIIVVAVLVGLGIFGWMGITRLVRATIFQIREMDYVEAARCLGASNKRIMIIHILPNVLAPLIVVVTFALAVNIVAEAGLAFLGFTDASLSSWGRELEDGVRIVSVAWWPVLFPALFIITAVMSFNLLGDGLRDAFDPRLR